MSESDSDTHGHIVAGDSRITREDAFLLGIVVGIVFTVLVLMVFGGPTEPAGTYPI